MTQLEAYRGDDWVKVLYFTDENGDAINITGWTIFFTVKKNEEDIDDDAVISKDITVHTNPTGGVSSIVLTDDDTDIPPREYWYDIQIKKATGAIKTVVKDNFEIHTDITRRIT
jgi:hypothetical protein